MLRHPPYSPDLVPRDFFPLQLTLAEMKPILPQLKSFSDDGDDFVQHIVAEDKTWCHHFQSSVCNGNIPTNIGPKNSKFSSQSER
ncbi:hypothetical protein TNCV_5096471 [Trichonephila clavipes]|nr:hypothetical protein TNCV_5096471 [Trichonephila clavipes]